METHLEPATGKLDDWVPLPMTKSINRSAVIAGKQLDYQVTVGSIALKEERGKVLGEVVYVAYTLADSASGRPVTFCFNGGPGAASAYLNIGGIGPQKVGLGGEDDYPSDPPVLRDNPDSWLDFTDLVFVDPIGTGYSRSRVDAEHTKKAFLTSHSDIEYLSRFVVEWLLRHERMASQKYLVGESYGGCRVPHMARYLQNTLGVGVSGVIMLSPALNTGMINNDVVSPTYSMACLPSMAAAYFERRGKTPDESLMAPIERYVRTEYVTDFFAGPADRAATARLASKVADLTGLDAELVRRLDGRVDPATYLRESRYAEGRVSSVYDPSITTYDPFPAQSTPNYDDPSFARWTALFASAMTDFLVNQVGWKVDARYYLDNLDLSRQFARDDGYSPVASLRKALAADPRMRAAVVNGWNDLACPYFMSKLVLAQLPSYGVGERVTLRVYPGGHMFYQRQESAVAFRRDILHDVYDART
jgi:carboxypeptidase C (cathepsin A)